MDAKLIICNVPSANLQQAQAFYGTLLGSTDFARSLTDVIESYHQPISQDGLNLTLAQRNRAGEPILCYFAVDDLQQALNDLQAAGGTVLVDPFDTPISPKVVNEFQADVQSHQHGTPTSSDLGPTALMRDPDGNVLGLIELRPQVHRAFKFGRFRQPLDRDQLEQHRRGKALGQRM